MAEVESTAADGVNGDIPRFASKRGRTSICRSSERCRYAAPAALFAGRRARRAVAARRFCHAVNTAGLMYDLRHTAGVFRSPAATSLITSLMQTAQRAFTALFGHRHLAEQRQRVQRGVPGAEVLGGEFLAHAFAQVVSSPVLNRWRAGRPDRPRTGKAPGRAVPGIDARASRAVRRRRAHRARRRPCRGSAAAPCRARETRVAIAQRCQPEAAVAARVLGVAHAHLRRIQQLHHQRAAPSRVAGPGRCRSRRTLARSGSMSLPIAQHARMLVRRCQRTARPGAGIDTWLAAARVAPSIRPGAR